jgi:hypothetical protein
MTEEDLTGCHGIMWHKDTEWQRCPKAKDFEHYRVRITARTLATKLCNTVEFEHFIPTDGR